MRVSSKGRLAPVARVRLLTKRGRYQSAGLADIDSGCRRRAELSTAARIELTNCSPAESPAPCSHTDLARERGRMRVKGLLSG